MRQKRALHLFIFRFAVVFVSVLFVSCFGEKPASEKENFSGANSSVNKAALSPSGAMWYALALLDTGENPLWFEFGPSGPVLVESPQAASLVPYIPWPHARHAAGMLVWDDFLVFAINRYGFLAMELQGNASGKNTEALLYRVADSNYWDPYTVESFFIWKNKPAALLYRNDFFTEPVASSPRPQVYVLDKYSPVPMGTVIPALEVFPSGEDWETELLRRGADGFWYYRMKEKGQEENGHAYFRAMDLEGKGEKVSSEEWRNSALPETPKDLQDPENPLDTGMPPHLSAVLDNAMLVLGLKEIPTLQLISPDFEGRKNIKSAAAMGHALGVALGGNSEAELSSLMLGYSSKTDSVAFAILPDGRGLYSFGEYTSGKKADAFFFSLPALPEGFVYTGVGLLGNILVASWEEQQEAGIGAAGIMVLASEFIQ